jgi:hypothetical protein
VETNKTALKLLRITDIPFFLLGKKRFNLLSAIWPSILIKIRTKIKLNLQRAALKK